MFRDLMPPFTRGRPALDRRRRDRASIVAQIEEFPPGTDCVERPGRAVRALLDDPAVSRHAGRTLAVAELAEQYGFADVRAPAGRCGSRWPGEQVLLAPGAPRDGRDRVRASLPT